ncbi:hypothetical protein PRIPAC_73903 [Pristionchus pacificus]|nr:hypothetical protein PRIPAC_73903 [Pristionchus pacificus]
MALCEVEGVTDVHEKEIAYLRRSVEMLKGDNMRLHEKADHLESRLLFFVEQNEEKTHLIDELRMQLSDAEVRERELRKELDGIDKPFRKSSIFGRKFSRKNSMASMLSSSHDTVHEGVSMHISQSSPFLLSSHGGHGMGGGGLLNPNHSVVFHRGATSNTLSSCDDVASIALSARASPDLSSIDGDSSIASYQRLGSTSGGGSIAGLAVGGGDSPHEVTTIEEKVDEERENMGGGSEEKKKEVEVVEEKKEKPPKRKRSLWMRVTSGLPKIPGEFVV